MCFDFVDYVEFVVGVVVDYFVVDDDWGGCVGIVGCVIL